MRTLLSHDAAAKWLATGDQARAEMLSSGGVVSVVSAVVGRPPGGVPVGVGGGVRLENREFVSPGMLVVDRQLQST